MTHLMSSNKRGKRKWNLIFHSKAYQNLATTYLSSFLSLESVITSESIGSVSPKGSVPSPDCLSSSCHPYFRQCDHLLSIHMSSIQVKKFSHLPAGFRSLFTPLFLCTVARFILLQYKTHHRPLPDFTPRDATILLNAIPQTGDQSLNS